MIIGLSHCLSVMSNAGNSRTAENPNSRLIVDAFKCLAINIYATGKEFCTIGNL